MNVFVYGTVANNSKGTANPTYQKERKKPLKHQTLNYSRKRKNSSLKEKRREPLSVHRRKANFYFICTFGIDFFHLIFFGQNVVNENIYTPWFPFSSAPGFVCCTKHMEAPAALALRVAEKPSGKSHILAGLAGDPWQEGGRVHGQVVERVDDRPASPVFILESNCVAAC